MTHRTVYVDPAGVVNGSYVVIAFPTGVTYMHRYGGRACHQGAIEGYLVPVVPDEAMPTLTSVFEHTLRGDGAPQPLPDDLLKTIINAVELVAFWPADDGPMEFLRVDLERLSILDEAWIPVLTSDGPGMFIWPNSD